MTNKFVNYGDVSPIEYGGLFIMKDTEDFPNGYNVVKLISMGWECNEEGWIIQDGYVELNDDWIEWDKVKDYIGLYDEEPDPIALVIGAWEYYGCYQFQGEEYRVATEVEVIEELSIKGIEV